MDDDEGEEKKREKKRNKLLEVCGKRRIGSFQANWHQKLLGTMRHP